MVPSSLIVLSFMRGDYSGFPLAMEEKVLFCGELILVLGSGQRREAEEVRLDEVESFIRQGFDVTDRIKFLFVEIG